MADNNNTCDSIAAVVHIALFTVYVIYGRMLTAKNQTFI